MAGVALIQLGAMLRPEASPPAKSETPDRVRPRAATALLALGVVTSFLGYTALSRLQDEQFEADLSADAGTVLSALDQQISQCLFALRSVGTFYGASQHVSAAEFEAFTTPLLASTPGARGYYWASHGEGDRYLIQYRNTVQGAGSLLTGHDLRGFPELRATVDNAQQYRDVASTAPIKLGGGPEVVFALLPVYRDPGEEVLPADRGSIPAGFVVAQVDPFAIAQRVGAPLHSRHLRLALSPDGPKNSTQDGLTVSAAHTRVRTPRVGDRTWLATVTADTGYSNDDWAWLPSILLLAGLMVTLLGVAYLTVLHQGIHNRAQATQLLASANQSLRVEIDERAAAERALRNSESRYRGLAETAFGGVLLLQDGRIVETNRPLHETLGYGEQELLGLRWQDLVSEPDREAVRSALESDSGSILETTVRHKNGAEIQVELGTKLLTEEDGNRALLTLRNIGDRKHLEGEQARIQRLESLGVMAGGLAHDFNNLLMSILGNLEVALLTVEPDSEAAKHLSEVQTATLRAREITKRLLTFARGGAPVRAPMDLSKAVRESVKLASAGSNCLVEVASEPELWPANGDPGQLSQVVHNLVLNAIQAMPQGGRVQVTCENEHISTATPTMAAGRYVRVRVRDEGPGIPQEHLAHVFEPYFSTKPSGHGLGLSASYSIVRSHRGTLQISASSNLGTEFSFWIPAAETQPASGTEAVLDVPGSWKGHVLVMDDDASIRRVLVKMLARAGLEATAVPHGQAAVEAVADRHGDFCLAILDLTVQAGMGGIDALRGIRKLNPTLKAVVSSGYSNDSAVSEHRKLGFDAVLQKPYTQQDLLRVLEQVLHPGSEPHTRG